MSNTGSCLCGALRYSFTGEPSAKGLCHCKDCRKISGSAFSMNAMFPADAVTLTAGAPKTYTVAGGSGKPITSFFCGECGSTVWRETPVFAGLRIVKAGTLDDPEALERVAKPVVEMFAANRVGWMPVIKETDQRKGQ
ncbi:Mss4-like protein [Schizophyllum fasciatum]